MHIVEKIFRARVIHRPHQIFIIENSIIKIENIFPLNIQSKKMFSCAMREVLHIRETHIGVVAHPIKKNKRQNNMAAKKKAKKASKKKAKKGKRK